MISKDVVYHVSDHDLSPSDVIQFEGYSSFGVEHTRGFEEKFKTDYFNSENILKLANAFGDDEKVDKIVRECADERVLHQMVILLCGHSLLVEIYKSRFQQMREYVFEKIRQQLKPDKVSRWNCIFVSETLDNAKRFKEEFRANAPSYADREIFIYEAAINADACISKADFRGIHMDTESIEEMESRATKYWEGEVLGNEPWWEVLVEGSKGITIKNKITE